MKFAPVFILIGFIAISAFGIFSMDSSTHDSHADGCIAATAQAADCPKENNPLTYLAFHVDGFKSFSNFVFSENLLGLLSLLIVLASVMGAGISRNNLAAPLLRRAYALRKHWQLLDPSSRQALIRYLARHENSPAVL